MCPGALLVSACLRRRCDRGECVPGLSSPRPAGRCLAELRAKHTGARLRAWVILFRPSSLSGAGGLGC